MCLSISGINVASNFKLVAKGLNLSVNNIDLIGPFIQSFTLI